MKSRKILFSDGEGPIVTNDFAMEITSSVSKNLFSVLSAYDDYLSVHDPKNYQAGDTLSLILPFLFIHGVTDNDMKKIARRAVLAPRVKTYIKYLQQNNWNIRIVSTAYTPLWVQVGFQLGVAQEHIASTDININSLRRKFWSEKIQKIVNDAELDIKQMTHKCVSIINSDKSKQSAIDLFKKNKACIDLRNRLDRLYWIDLPEEGYNTLSIIEVIGGIRKVDAAERFARLLGATLKDVIYVGDSITDVELFRKVNKSGGLSVAVNGNRYALEAATIAVATTNMEYIIPLLNEWVTGGMNAVSSFIHQNNKNNDVHYACVNTNNSSLFNTLVNRHAQVRKIIRADAAVLG
jgi:energy-converting hydrogenase A subunit R